MSPYSGFAARNPAGVAHGAAPNADVVRITEGNMGSAITRAPAQSGVVEDPEHVWKLFAREPGGLGFGRRMDTVGPRREDEGTRANANEGERYRSRLASGLENAP